MKRRLEHSKRLSVLPNPYHVCPQKTYVIQKKSFPKNLKKQKNEH